MLVVFVASIAVSPLLPDGQTALSLLALLLIGISEATSSKRVRARNRFAWTPMREIAVLFFAIFATIPPVLQAVSRLPLGRDPALWFWASGICSALLDSAPTYLMFFQAAGPDLARLLPSFSAGSVLFGALTYLGNAPNLMIRAIAARRGVKMPGFLGYALVASAMLVPILLIETLVFFR
jgi:Na+/H+ antiporter NhaD/arsenite permease-like protein